MRHFKLALVCTVLILLLGILAQKIQERQRNEALLEATKQGNTSAVRTLLQSGAALMKDSVRNRTAAECAASDANSEMLVLMLNHFYSHGQCPAILLARAASSGSTSNIDILLRRRIDVNIRFGGGITALMASAEGGHESAVRMLLTRGADPNAVDDRDDTVLMYAVSRGKQRITKILLENGAQFDPRSKDGLILMRTALKTDPAIAEILRRSVEQPIK
jgi:uncharacterized protein